MSIDKLIDHLPFLDGAGRRRFVAGGIILIGVAVQNPDLFKDILGLEELDVADILGSPVIAGGAVLLVYAIGSLAEMLGELSLVRAASGIFLALQFPGQVVTWEAVPNRHWFYGFLIIIMKFLLYVTVVPFMVLYFAAAGFLGYTKFAIDIHRRASAKAWAVFEKLPDAAQRGLHQPVGNDTDFAQKYIVDLLTNEPDRKWARRLIIRAKDVAATITALQVVVLYTLLSFGIELGNTGQNEGKSAQLQIIAKDVTVAANNLQERHPTLQSVLFLDNIHRTVRRYDELAERDFPRYRISRLRSQQRVLKSDRERVEREIAQLNKQLEESKRATATAAPRSPILQLQRGVKDADAKKAKQIKEKQIEDRRRVLERRLAELKRRPDNADVLKLVSEDATAARITELQGAMINYRDYFTAEQERKLLTNLILTAAWLFFLPLYLGYFTTLRNAIAAILEMVAAADDSAAVPEGAQ
jgi:hypothetical protein